MNGYSSLHFYIQKTNLCNTELKKCTVLFEKKKQVDVHLSKSGSKIFLNLVGIEVFSKLFPLFFSSPGINKHWMCSKLITFHDKNITSSFSF
jgi:hypothetical protein